MLMLSINLSHLVFLTIAVKTSQTPKVVLHLYHVSKFSIIKKEFFHLLQLSIPYSIINILLMHLKHQGFRSIKALSYVPEYNSIWPHPPSGPIKFRQWVFFTIQNLNTLPSIHQQWAKKTRIQEVTMLPAPLALKSGPWSLLSNVSYGLIQHKRVSQGISWGYRIVYRTAYGHFLYRHWYSKRPLGH
jgi:hypothetical protein